MKRLREENGFTLVELAVTVAIIGILASISIPTMINVLPRVRLGGVAQTLSNEIAMTRMSAIAKSSDYGIQINPTTEEYTLGRYVSGAFTPFTSSKIGAAAEIANVRYKSDYTMAPNLIRLYANGTTSVPLNKEAVYIQLQTKDGTVKRRIAVYATGRVFREKWTSGPDSNPASWKVD